MLTNQHRFAGQIINRSERRVYKKHMCGVCHALGDDYGLLSRLFTNHEMILLNMLVEAQFPEESPAVLRRCPLNPTLRVRTNQTDASRFAAGVAVMLVNAGLEDDIQDGDGRALLSRGLKRIGRGTVRKAMASLEQLSYDVNMLKNLPQAQVNAEHYEDDPIQPTAEMSASLFTMTAKIANQPENEEALAILGAQYGEHLYLLDAFKDFSEDIARGQFNPLARFASREDQTYTLSPEGLRWLLAQFEQIAATMRVQLAQLKLHRYQEAVNKLLLTPVERMIARLKADQAEDGLRFMRYGLWDVLRAALLLAPTPLSVASLSVDSYITRNTAYDYDEEADEKPKRGKRKRRARRTEDDRSSSWCDLYGCYYVDCGSGDRDCDGVPNCMENGSPCDSNGDGIPNCLEGASSCDSDGDGLMNCMDIDSCSSIDSCDITPDCN